ncbi:MAG: bile acid:sodium symporter family protein [Desulfotomaculum sp.]|nr:bile acid:sodium symporter family protein [Desulfotomaculum sp.]
MLNLLYQWNQFLGQRMFYAVLIPLLIGFVAPIETTPFWSIVATLSFTYMTFAASLDTSLADFLSRLSRPWLSIWMLIFIHGVMPFIAYIIGLVFYPGPENELIRLGFLLGASIPVAVTSILWSQMVGGDVPLTTATVTLDTLISPLLLPLFIVLVVGKTVHIDTMNLLMRLFWMVTVPGFLGMIIHDYTKGAFKKYTQSIGGFTSKIAIILVVYINASAVAPEIEWNYSVIKLLLVILIVSISGYSLGFLSSYILKGHQHKRMVSMIYAIGMRNNSLGLVLALTYFPPAVALPITLSMLYQQPLAAVTSKLVERFNKEKCDPKIYEKPGG